MKSPEELLKEQIKKAKLKNGGKFLLGNGRLVTALSFESSKSLKEQQFWLSPVFFISILLPFFGLFGVTSLTR